MARKAEALPPLLTVEETARYLRIGRNQAYRLVSDGTIYSVKLGRTIRVPSATLLAWLAGQHQLATAPSQPVPLPERRKAVRHG